MLRTTTAALLALALAVGLHLRAVPARAQADPDDGFIEWVDPPPPPLEEDQAGRSSRAAPSGAETAAEEPSAEEPAAAEPAPEEPDTEEPANGEPAADDPAAEEPATEERASGLTPLARASATLGGCAAGSAAGACCGAATPLALGLALAGAVIATGCASSCGTLGFYYLAFLSCLAAAPASVGGLVLAAPAGVIAGGWIVDPLTTWLIASAAAWLVGWGTALAALAPLAAVYVMPSLLSPTMPPDVLTQFMWGGLGLTALGLGLSPLLAALAYNLVAVGVAESLEGGDDVALEQGPE